MRWIKNHFRFDVISLRKYNTVTILFHFWYYILHSWKIAFRIYSQKLWKMDLKGKGQHFNNGTEMRWIVKGKMCRHSLVHLKNGKVLLWFFFLICWKKNTKKKKKRIFDVTIRNETKKNNKLFTRQSCVGDGGVGGKEKRHFNWIQSESVFSLIDFGTYRHTERHKQAIHCKLLDIIVIS